MCRFVLRCENKKKIARYDEKVKNENRFILASFYDIMFVDFFLFYVVFNLCLLSSPERLANHQTEVTTGTNPRVNIPESPSSTNSSGSAELNSVLPRPHISGPLSPPPPPTEINEFRILSTFS